MNMNFLLKHPKRT